MLTDDEIGRILDGESPIRVIREHRGFTVRQLAHLAGLRPEQLERYEKGRTSPRADRLRRIAEALDVDPVALRSCEENFADCGRLLRHVEDE